MANVLGQYGPEALPKMLGSLSWQGMPTSSVDVREVGTSTALTLYTDLTGVTTASNPVAIDADGDLKFVCRAGPVDIRVQVTPGVYKTRTVMVPPDPARLANIINASQYGVSASATAAANATALTAALAAATAQGGGDVQLPAEAFSWSGLITVPNEVNLIGAGPYATVMTGSNAAAQIRFGDGGGSTTVINYGGESGGFRIIGTAATNPLFVGLCVGRSFTDIDILNAVGDGLRIEQTQNCYFREVNVTGCTGSNFVLDYGAGGNKFSKCELYGAGRSNLRVTYTAANTGGGYALATHNIFDTCLFEGTKASTVACCEFEGGIRTELRNCHLTLLSGANGHADLYGTDIPVISMSKAHADAGAVSHSLILTGGTQVWGSKPAASSVYKGVGIKVTNTPGETDLANVYIEGGCRIVYCSSAVSTQVASRIDVTGTLEMATNTARYTPTSGTHTESTILRHRGHAAIFTTPDPAVQALVAKAAASQTANVFEAQNSAGTAVGYITNAGSLIVLSTVNADKITTASRGTVGSPAYQFNNDPDCGMYSPTTNEVALAAGGAKQVHLTATGLGFYGVTPVVQPAANADTSGADLATLETEVNQLKALLRSIGLMVP